MIIKNKAELKKFPAISNSDRPSPKMSDKYIMVNSMKIVDEFEKFNYFPVFASQNGHPAKATDTHLYQSHIIRFRHKDFMDIGLQEVAPEIVFANSHNGRIKAQVYAGLYRMVCSNGLVVTTEEFGKISQKHIGIEASDIEKVIFDFAKRTDNTMGLVSKYSKTELSEYTQRDFARTVKNQVFGKDSNLDSNDLLRPRRDDDWSKDLFTTYNVIQENITKGGLKYRSAKKITATKGIQNIERTIDVNTFLWNTMDDLYKSQVA